MEGRSGRDADNGRTEAAAAAEPERQGLHLLKFFAR